MVGKFSHCLLCQERLTFEPGLKEWFSFKPIQMDCLCPSCRNNFLEISTAGGEQCQGCCRPLDAMDGDKYHRVYYINNDLRPFCYDCYRWAQEIDTEYLKHKALLAYNDGLRSWLHRYKYIGDLRLAQVVDVYLHEAYKDYREYVWLVLPSSPQSLAERGFHPTRLILESAGIEHHCPFDYIGDGKRQAQKTRQERLQLEQPFAINTDRLELIKDQQKLLIFDDIYTTGSTLMQAKQLLKQELPTIELRSMSLARNIE